MSKIKNQEIADYQEFLAADGEKIPQTVKDQVFRRISKLMNPSAVIVFFKVLAIHLVVGFFSMSICHQFGMNPFNTERSMSDWMMSVGGHRACMAGCGVVFIGLSLFAAGYFLTIEEVKALKKTELLQTLALGVISLGLFVAFGAEMAVGIAGLWLLGGLIGGVAATQAIWKLKQI